MSPDEQTTLSIMSYIIFIFGREFELIKKLINVLNFEMKDQDFGSSYPPSMSFYYISLANFI